MYLNIHKCIGKKKNIYNTVIIMNLFFYELIEVINELSNGEFCNKEHGPSKKAIVTSGPR